MKFIEFKMDKIRKFRMSMLAMDRIEKKFGKAFAKIDHYNLTTEEFSFIMWACASQADRDEVSPERFLELLDECNIKEVNETFALIMGEAFGSEEKKV